MKFDRTKGLDDLLKKLKEEELYKNYLSKDSDVFMALRSNEIHFYYKGSKLFGYKSQGFESHKKYCFNAAFSGDYIKIDALGSIKPIVDMDANYKLIKENAKNYAGVEAEGISNLYKYNFLTQGDYILLDTEIAFYDDESKDRIDLLVFDTLHKELKFIEAKDFTNGELWAKENASPKVVEQIQRYNTRVANNKEEILAEYQSYVDLINRHFETSLPKPESICEDVSLFMFGFDNNQKEKIERLLKEDGSLDGIHYYFKGSTKNLDLKTLYNS